MAYSIVTDLTPKDTTRHPACAIDGPCVMNSKLAGLEKNNRSRVRENLMNSKRGKWNEVPRLAFYIVYPNIAARSKFLFHIKR
jgi:hypothetical protein